MTRQDMTYRIIKIGKTAVSVAVCGLMASLSGAAIAQTLNPTAVVGQNVLTTPVQTYTGTGKGIEVYAQEVANDGDETHTTAVTVTLQNGTTITGSSPVGGQLLGIYSSEKRDAGDTDNSGDVDRFSFSGSTASSLVLNGGNTISGDVGYTLKFNSGGVLTGSYSVFADALDEVVVNGDVRFNGNVNATAINVNSAGGNITFMGLVDRDGAKGGTTTQLDYNGHNVTVTLGAGAVVDGTIINKGGSSNSDSPLGDRTNGSLVLQGAAEVTGQIGDGTSGLSLIRVDGSGSTVTFGGSVTSNQLDFGAAANVSVTGSLIMSPDASPAEVKGVTFNQKDGSLTIIGGNLTGLAAQPVVSNTVDGRGVLTFVGTGVAQSVTGGLGSSGLGLKLINIGGPATDNFATVVANGDVFAQTVSLNNGTGGNDATLSLGAGYNLTDTNGGQGITTDAPGMGNLYLLGGMQTVTGSVGGDGLGGNSPKLNSVNSAADINAVSTFTGKVYATTVSNTGAGKSTYQDDVTATTVNVAAGESNFSKALNATNTNIGAGTGNFSSTSTTTSAIVFTGGNGIANLNNGLTGTVNFGGQTNATVNLADSKSISGAITTTAANTGVLNALGAATLSSDVGTGGAIKALNVNTSSSSSKVVVANGNVNAQTVSLQNDGVLRMAHGMNLTGTVSTTAAGAGGLDFLGTSVVTGNVGAAGTGLKTIGAGVTDGTVTFTNGVVYANTLNYSGNGEVRFNGNSAGSGVNDRGFVGVVDFGTNVSSIGTFKLGDAVDLVTQNASGASANSQTSFLDANGASLRFVGNSTITGDLGTADNVGNQNFGHVFADGATGKVVNFLGKVYVSSSTFNVAGTGTVNFQDDLYGPLYYIENGVVNVADTKAIYPSTDATAAGSVTTRVSNTGTLNFLGSTTTQVAIGTSALPLNTVRLHSSTDVPTATVNIGHDVYATNTSIGNASGTTTANITATGKYLGTNFTLSDATTLNTAGDSSTYGKFANGTLSLPSGTVVTQSLVGGGVLTANKATLNFSVATQPWAVDSNGTGGLVDATGSSNITGAAGSTLAIDPASTVNVTLLGSVKNAQSATLIDVASGIDASSGVAILNDNSYVIDTQLSRVNGDLILTALRDENTYVTKTGTDSHFSNNAAIRLGTLAANGVGYGQDLQTVLNILDIDQWGYGNNQANLATQVKRLAPIANNSLGLSALSLGAMAADSIGLRMHELRNVPQKGAYESTSFWLKNNNQRGTQSAVGDHDGYTNKLSGVTMGLDSRPNNSSLVGAALSYGSGTVKQTEFRTGDQANLKSWQLSMYGAYDITPELFMGGALSFAKQNTEGNRTTAIDRVAKFDFDGTQSAYKVDVGYRIKFPNTAAILTPMISLEGRSLKQDAYTETNAGDIGLSVASQRLQSKQTGVGLRLTSTESIGGMIVKPELMVMSVRDRGHYSDAVASGFIGDATAAASFNTDVAAYSPRSTKVALGVGLLMSKTSSLALRYQHVKRDTFKSNMAELLVRWDL
jgi:uncharacterized protein with beta-barrel porin domain